MQAKAYKDLNIMMIGRVKNLVLLKYISREWSEKILSNKWYGNKFSTYLLYVLQKHYDKYDGFVVLHGTDTMAYTASALSFMCENLGKPIILTGSQVSTAVNTSSGLSNHVCQEKALIDFADRGTTCIA